MDEPGKGSIRIGYNWKVQPGALRRDVDGDLYRALFDLTLNYRFLYLSGDVGLMNRLEASVLLTYLWAAETVDSTAEDPSHFYNGASDMWVGLKYQVLDGEFPVAVAAQVRLPYLYESSSVKNGQLLTEIPGLLRRDYDLNVHASHSFSSALYATTTAGIRLREGAATNQILYGADAGYKLPILDDRIELRLGLDGVASVGTPDPSTSKDRFQGRQLERAPHFFDFNDASYTRGQMGLSVEVLPSLSLSGGYSYILWGHSVVVHEDFVVQAGYSF